MNPERWQQIKDLFQSAMDVPAEERATFLDSACGNDAGLRSEVESLLAADRNSDRFHRGRELARLAVHEAISRSDPMVGREIGTYRIERLLGHGGMGTVYAAKNP